MAATTTLGIGRDATLLDTSQPEGATTTTGAGHRWMWQLNLKAAREAHANIFCLYAANRKTFAKLTHVRTA